MIEKVGGGVNRKENSLSIDILYALKYKMGKRDHGCHQLWQMCVSGGNTRRI